MQRDTGRSRLAMSCASGGRGSSVSCQWRDEFARRADQFASGRWTELINQARQTATRISRATPDLDEAEDQRRRENAAQSRIHHKQVSRARHELTGVRLAPKQKRLLPNSSGHAHKNSDGRSLPRFSRKGQAYLKMSGFTPY